jgi:hypothetical protein
MDEQSVKNIMDENEALRRTLATTQTPKPWYQQWKRWGAILAVLLPIVNQLAGKIVDDGVVMLVVTAIIMWVGIEAYRDQKITVAKTMADASIDVKKIELATAPMFRAMVDKLKSGGQGIPPQPPKNP